MADKYLTSLLTEATFQPHLHTETTSTNMTFPAPYYSIYILIDHDIIWETNLYDTFQLQKVISEYKKKN